MKYDKDLDMYVLEEKDALLMLIPTLVVLAAAVVVCAILIL